MFNGLKKLLFSNAVMKIDESKLDFSIVEKFKSRLDILEILYDWILIPDKHYLNKLLKIKPEIDKIQPVVLPKILYRGYSSSSGSMQDQMGSKYLQVNDVFKYKLVNPISFTAELKIAQSFGNIVITYMVDKDIAKQSIYLTDEICYCICKEIVHSEPETQKEVIIFPNGKIKEIVCTILKIK